MWNTECSQIQRGQDCRWSTLEVLRWRRRLHHWHALSPSKRIIFIKSLLGLSTSHLVTRLSLVTIGLVFLRNSFHFLYPIFEILRYLLGFFCYFNNSIFSLFNSQEEYTINKWVHLFHILIYLFSNKLQFIYMKAKL